MMIPSTDVWPRIEFCYARKRQMDSQKVIDKGAGIDATYVEHGIDIIYCDTCNATINDAVIRLVEFGRRVACKPCYNRLYASEPMRWRELNEDGTLGTIIERREID